MKYCLERIERDELVAHASKLLGLSVLEIANAMDTEDLGSHVQHVFVLESIAAVLRGIDRAGQKKHFPF
mgnify:CR=1 FL=1